MRRVRADVGDLEETSTVADDPSHCFSQGYRCVSLMNHGSGVHVSLIEGEGLSHRTGAGVCGHGLPYATTTRG